MMRERFKEFVDFLKSRHSRKIREGGCDTCGYGAWTVANTLDLDDMHDLDYEIDKFIEEMKARREAAKAEVLARDRAAIEDANRHNAKRKARK